jgi:tetratricopeptide (TPR) repeat protein
VPELLFWAVFIAATSAPAETTACPIARPVTHDQAWRSACDAAIAAATDSRVKAELLFRSAYTYNEQESYSDAQGALQAATRLDPAHVGAWRELSYTENALGNYAPAEAAADRAIALAPDHVQPYQERAMARHFQGNLEGAWADRDRLDRLSPGDAGKVLGRAEEAMWLGRFDEAAADLDAAAAQARDDQVRQSVERRRNQLRLLRTRSAAADPAAACVWPDNDADVRRPGFIGDCTAAFLAESRPARRAGFLTIRSMAWLSAAQDNDAATADRQIAAALDPGNHDMHANLGFAYLSVSHSWAAAREFDRALAIRESWSGLAGRAAAKYNLHDPDGAFADARRSFEIQPNELALTVLGDLSHDRGDTTRARSYWMSAYHLGDRDDGLIQRLRSIGVDHPENEPVPR